MQPATESHFQFKNTFRSHIFQTMRCCRSISTYKYITYIDMPCDYNLILCKQVAERQKHKRKFNDNYRATNIPNLVD